MSAQPRPTVLIPATRPEPGALCCAACAGKTFRLPCVIEGGVQGVIDVDFDPANPTARPLDADGPLLICAHVAVWMTAGERGRALSLLRRWTMAPGPLGRAQRHAAYTVLRFLREFPEVLAGGALRFPSGEIQHPWGIA